MNAFEHLELALFRVLKVEHRLVFGADHLLYLVAQDLDLSIRVVQHPLDHLGAQGGIFLVQCLL